MDFDQYIMTFDHRFTASSHQLMHNNIKKVYGLDFQIDQVTGKPMQTVSSNKRTILCAQVFVLSFDTSISRSAHLALTL